MSLMVVGSDSFIAQALMRRCNAASVRGISRTVARTPREVVVSDLSTISEKEFRDVDVVVNFAAIVHRPDIRDPSIYDQVNHELAVLNARKAREAGVRLFIQMSTIAVYGEAASISVHTPYAPRTPYGSSKLRADQELCQMQDDRFKVALIRPPMVYGGGRAPGNMMRLIRLADTGVPLPFKGVDNRRDFIHVENLTQYLEIVAQRRLHGTFLVTDHQPVSTEYILQVISKHLGKRVRMTRVPQFGLRLLKTLRPKEYDKLFGSLTIETNFAHEESIERHSVDEGIGQMVAWYGANGAR